MRRRRLAIAAALPCALLLSMPLAAQQVYKWKDANGVIQYTATPPPTGSYETREVDHHQAPAAADAARPAEDPVCAQARAALALLRGNTAVQVDSDGDGKPDRTLTESERADRVALTEATIKVSCDATPPAPEPEGDAGEEEPEEM